MDLRQLKTILLVAELGTVTKAARRLRIAETALSRQIRLVEAEFKTALFIRHSRGLKPTEAGHQLIKRAQPLLAAFDQLNTDMKSRRNVVSGKVSIGIPWLLLETLSVRLATEFIPRHPGVNIRFVGGASNNLRQMLLAGDLDIALMFDTSPSPDLTLTPLFSERLLLVGHRANAYRLNRPVLFSHLARVPLTLPEMDEPFRQQIEALAKTQGVTLDIRYELSALQPQRALATKGLAQFLASLHAVRADVEAGVLTAAPVHRPPIVRTLVLGTRRKPDLSAAVEQVVNATRTEIAMLVDSGSFLAR